MVVPNIDSLVLRRDAGTNVRITLISKGSLVLRRDAGSNVCVTLVSKIICLAIRMRMKGCLYCVPHDYANAITASTSFETSSDLH